MDHQDFKTLVLSTERRSKLFSYAMSLTNDFQKAEDLVQETLIKAHEAWASFKPVHFDYLEASVFSWLKVICRNAFINEFRAMKRRPLVLARDEETQDLMFDNIENASFSAAQVSEQTEDKDILKGAIKRLPEYAQDVAYLVLVEDLSYQEAADVLGIALGTVMSRLHRARKRLQQDPEIRMFLELPSENVA